MPITLLWCLKQVPASVHIHHIGQQGLGCFKGCRHSTNYISAGPQTLPVIFFSHTLFHLASVSLCWQLIYDLPNPNFLYTTQAPSHHSEKVQPDKPRQRLLKLASIPRGAHTLFSLISKQRTSHHHNPGLDKEKAFLGIGDGSYLHAQLHRKRR